jgi:hypothetical protein
VEAVIAWFMSLTGALSRVSRSGGTSQSSGLSEAYLKASGARLGWL